MTQNASDTGGQLPAAAARPAWLDHLAHDLRGPLSPLVNGISILRSGRLDAAQQGELLVAMQRQLEALMELIDDTAELLARRGGTTATTDLASIVDMAAVRAARRVADVGVALDARVPQTPIAVDVDARRLVRLIAHLAVRTACAAGAGNGVVMDVETDGVRVRVRLTIERPSPEANAALAALAEKLMQPSPLHVADAALRDVLVRHAAGLATIADAAGGACGILLDMPAASAAPA